MKSVTLVRLFTGSHGTFGRMKLEGKEWWTIERSKTGPHPAIPVGTYALSYGTHHAGQPNAYPCYWLDKVPGRSAIQIHVANLASELEGCIAPGLTVGFPMVDGEPQLGLVSSGNAFRNFMRIMQEQPGEITITEQF